MSYVLAPYNKTEMTALPQKPYWQIHDPSEYHTGSQGVTLQLSLANNPEWSEQKVYQQHLGNRNNQGIPPILKHTEYLQHIWWKWVGYLPHLTTFVTSWWPLTMAELENAMSRLKVRKAAGLSGRFVVVLSCKRLLVLMQAVWRTF